MRFFTLTSVKDQPPFVENKEIGKQMIRPDVGIAIYDVRKLVRFKPLNGLPHRNDASF